jgi:ribosomal protein S18 acetylase RimI-like enzyme
MEVEVRLLTSADASLFERVADEVFDEPVDPKRLAAYLAEPGHFMLVALAGGEIVAQDKATELYIDEVGVTPRFQRQGLARRMLDQMFAIGRGQGCEEAWVGTEHDNAPARRLYESCGSEAEPFVMYVYKL